MARPRAVSAKNRPYKHVELSDGDWINIKVKLNYGEASELYDATYRSNVGSGDRGTQRVLQMARFNVDRILIYTRDWSFIDDENNPLPVSAESIRALDTETTDEIHAAINAVEAESERQGNEPKNVQPAAAGSHNGSNVSSPTPLVGASPTERTD